MSKTLVYFSFLLFLLTEQAYSAVVVKRMAYRDPDVPTVVLAGEVDQTALDAAMTSCGTGCNFFLVQVCCSHWLYYN